MNNFSTPYDVSGQPLNWTDDAWERCREHWALADGVTYLNHGSFGKAPTVVDLAREHWRQEIEAGAFDFFENRLGRELKLVRQRLATFVGCAEGDLALVENTTAGMNAVAASVPLSTGDEVLLNDHEYGAVERLWRARCAAAGATLVVREIPTPVVSHDDVARHIIAGITSRTKLVVLSHVTSPTATIMPVAAVCRAAKASGARLCVDGAHAPAMLPLDLTSLDCDYYVASCHKWLCGARGSGFFYAHPRRQAEARPAIISWGRTLPGDEPSWRDAFNWSGTRDVTPLLAIPAAIDFLEELGLNGFRGRSHHLAKYARERLLALDGAEAITADDDSLFGSMAAVRLADGDAKSLRIALWEKYRIEAPVLEWNAQRLIRVSCHLYNRREEIDDLVAAVDALLAAE